VKSKRRCMSLCDLVSVTKHFASDAGGRGVYGVVHCWGSGLESPEGMDILLLVFFCFCDKLITRSGES